MLVMKNTPLEESWLSEELTLSATVVVSKEANPRLFAGQSSLAPRLLIGHRLALLSGELSPKLLAGRSRDRNVATWVFTAAPMFAVCGRVPKDIVDVCGLVVLS